MVGVRLCIHTTLPRWDYLGYVVVGILSLIPQDSQPTSLTTRHIWVQLKILIHVDTKKTLGLEPRNL